MSTLPYTQWQTARASIVAADTPLTNYKPTDLTDAVRAKMFGIHPATAILLRAFGVGAATNSATIIISGWMRPGGKFGSGPGHRLWRGNVVLGSKSLAGELPNNDKKWLAGTYLEASDWDPTLGSGYDPTVATEVAVANQEAVLLLPTLGYTDILIEAAALTTLTNIGLLWRPALTGGVMKTF